MLAQVFFSGLALGSIYRLVALGFASFLIVEHDIPVIMDISDKIVVLDFGRKIAEGTPHEVQANEAVIAACLGTEHGAAADAVDA